MFRAIAYYLIFGRPLIMYLGILTFLTFCTAALIALSILRGANIPLKWHIRIACLALILAVIHGFLGLASYL